MKYSEIIKRNRELGLLLKNAPYNISILSNITTNSLHAPLELALRRQGVNAVVTAGNFDNIVQDSCSQTNSKAVIIFWEIINLQYDLPINIQSWKESEIILFIEECRSKIDFVLNNLNDVPLVIFNRFSAASCQGESSYQALSIVAQQLNAHLENRSKSNRVFIDLEPLLNTETASKTFSMRDYESFASLYTLEFYRDYVTLISPLLMTKNGHIKKVFICDCDNTLWKGVVGEDGIEGISGESENSFFNSLQKLILDLKKKGILIGICSKNNLTDIESVFKSHPQMLIGWEHIDIHRVNWDDKVTNLRSMAEELNLGLDSFVYLDDSPYEIEFIKKNLPEVCALLVPQDLRNQRSTIQLISNLFWTPTITDEDLSRSEMVKAEKMRFSEKEKFHSLNDYLKDLDLKLKIEINPRAWIPRLSQLTMKTNQFNTTTPRISETDLHDIFSRENQRVYAFEARDKYGDYGITGLAIVERRNSAAELKAFLMSCRTIGRDFERAFFSFIVSDLSSLGIKSLECRYVRTAKNHLVADLFDTLGCKLQESSELERKYILDLSSYQSTSPHYVSIQKGSETSLENA